MTDIEAKTRFSLIKENLAEILNPEIIENILAEGRHPKIYWGESLAQSPWTKSRDEDKSVRRLLTSVLLGTATTGRPHCGYFVCAIKIAQYLAAGCDVTILLADIVRSNGVSCLLSRSLTHSFQHGFLDNLKAPIELVEYRAKYYRFVITAILEAVGVPTEKLRFVLGSSYQKSPGYIMDVYKLCAVVSEHDAKKVRGVISAPGIRLRHIGYPRALSHAGWMSLTLSRTC
jgi:tyrosyl-tRNA synthetase